MGKTLIVLLGPTAVGKTAMSINLAQHYGTPIISSDSRQIYSEMSIGTAVPSDHELSLVKHYFIKTISIHDYFNSWQFEVQALEVINDLFESGHDVVLMTGGSMMYIDAVCNGIDDIPTISPEVRQSVVDKYETEGLESIKSELLTLDPTFYNEVDLHNAKRVMHAVEVCRMAGVPYSSLRCNKPKDRGFDIVKVGLTLPMDELYDRINCRVDLMIEDGLEQEASSLYKYRSLNSLNTVGYKEFFAFFDGQISKEEAIRLIKRNSRHYAKKQMTWFRRDEKITWFNPHDFQAVSDFLYSKIGY